MKPAKAVGIQYGALPYRLRGRQVEILLMTSRETRRWVIPKGWPAPGLSPPEGAAREAEEEAGLLGPIETQPIGSYRYIKRMKADRRIAVQVITFPLRVEGQAATFKEEGQRTAQWLPYQKAATKVAEASLRRLIREFGKARTPAILPKVISASSRLRGLFSKG